MEIIRGDVLLVDLDPVVGSEQGKTRPALVIQNNLGNKFSSTIIVAPITSKKFSKVYLTNIELFVGEGGLEVNSTVLLGQIRTIDKSRVLKKLGKVDEEKIRQIDEAIKISLALR